MYILWSNKINNVAHKRFCWLLIDLFFYTFDKTVEFCQNILGEVTSRVKGPVRMRAAESLAAAAAAGLSPTAVCDVAGITVSCSSPLEMARYSWFLFPPRANVKLG